MLHKKSLIVIVLSLAVLIGCKDNVIESPDNVLQSSISKMVTDSANYSIFLYSGERLMKYEIVQNHLTTLSMSFTYNADEKIKSEEIIRSGPINEQRLYQYIYDSAGKASQIEFYIKDGGSYEKYGEFICSYDQNNKLTETIFTNMLGDSTEKTQYSYYVNGNTKEKIRYANSHFYDKITYEYDDKINPMEFIYSTTYYGMVVGRNNFIKKVTESTINPQTSLAKYNYIYAVSGYPLSCMFDYTDSDSNIMQMSYEYEYN